MFSEIRETTLFRYHWGQRYSSILHFNFEINYFFFFNHVVGQAGVWFKYISIFMTPEASEKILLANA